MSRLSFSSSIRQDMFAFHKSICTEIGILHQERQKYKPIELGGCSF